MASEIIISIFFSFLMTLIIEYILVKIFYIKQKDVFKSVLLVNLLTNPLVVFIVNLYIWFVSLNATKLILFLEIGVIAVEGYVYSKLLSTTKRKAYIVSFIANSIAYFIGMMIINLYY